MSVLLGSVWPNSASMRGPDHGNRASGASVLLRMRGPEHGKRIQGAHGASADAHSPEHGKRGRGVHGASASILCTPPLELFTVPLELVLETRRFLTKAKTLL